MIWELVRLATNWQTIKQNVSSLDHLFTVLKRNDEITLTLTYQLGNQLIHTFLYLEVVPGVCLGVVYSTPPPDTTKGGVQTHQQMFSFTLIKELVNVLVVRQLLWGDDN